MKLIVEPNSKNILEYKNYIDGIVLGLVDFSVLNSVSFTLNEIGKIKEEYSDLEVFVKIDKNIFNNEIDKLKEILIYLDKICIDGIFFYDLSLLHIKRELDLGVHMIWNQTHMVTNYRTCDYYFEKGCKYALVSKEITLEEILDIHKLSKINVIVEVLSLPSVAYSRRKLVTNYMHDSGSNSLNSLDIVEKVTHSEYRVLEDDFGTGFLLDTVLNGTSILKELYNHGVGYVLMREYGIDDFLELIKDTKRYIDAGCLDSAYIEKYKKLGDNTGFFFKKTIYKVKK